MLLLVAASSQCMSSAITGVKELTCTQIKDELHCKPPSFTKTVPDKDKTMGESLLLTRVALASEPSEAHTLTNSSP